MESEAKWSFDSVKALTLVDKVLMDHTRQTLELRVVLDCNRNRRPSKLGIQVSKISFRFVDVFSIAKLDQVLDDSIVHTVANGVVSLYATLVMLEAVASIFFACLEKVMLSNSIDVDQWAFRIIY